MNNFKSLLALGVIRAQSGEDLLFAETRSEGSSEDRVFTMPMDPVGAVNNRSLQSLYEETSTSQGDEEPELAESYEPVGTDDYYKQFEEVESTTDDSSRSYRGAQRTLRGGSGTSSRSSSSYRASNGVYNY
jgi:hypothetical protein